MKKLLIIASIALLGSFASTSQQLPYQDPTLSPEERAADLCSRLTLEEKAKLMMNGSPAIERLGIPAYDWWSEALHGVGRNGLCTVFPSCIGMAASFDDDLIEEIFSAISDEARAKNNVERLSGASGKYKGLTFWTPTINIFRDPRWGRGQESYGEDPYMNGRMGVRVVRGLQGDPTAKYLKLAACAKHFAVHSGPEKLRHTFDVNNISARDLWETYLPAFEQLVKEGNVRQVMCAYQRYDGEACCGSNTLLQSILRDEWGFDGVVVSDCGAITDFLPGRHGVSPDSEAASALGARSGTDVECGSQYKKLPGAVRRGDIFEEEIDINVRRLLAERFRVGDLDPDSLVEWTSIPQSVISSDAHRSLARKMAREQMVLLKNNGILPLSPYMADRITVMGPNAADSVMLWGIYYGEPAHSVTMLEGLETRLGRQLPYRQGCTIVSPTEEQSIFDKFVSPDGTPGLLAEYWNNTNFDGTPDVTVNCTSALKLDNGGNTAFAPGVNLTDFTTRMRGSFVADRDETLTLLFSNDDGFRIILNGDTIHNRWRAEQLNYRSKKIDVVKGQRYDLEINYMQLAGDATLNFDIIRQVDAPMQDVIAATDNRDIVIFVGGISPIYEREQTGVTEPGFDGGDRTTIELPDCQRRLLAALHRAGKKIIFVNCSGSAVGLTPENQFCDAILQAWYPGEQGGHALADVLFGDYNPSGKLPVTFYADDSQIPPFEEYRMAGRTYRYLLNEPLYRFGHGLSYTTFDIDKPAYADGIVTVNVKNTGNRQGTEIIQVYLRRDDDLDGPAMTLRGYTRVDLQPGEQQTVEIPLPTDAFKTWNPDLGRMAVVPGAHTLYIGNSSDPADLHALAITLP